MKYITYIKIYVLGDIIVEYITEILKIFKFFS
jgi:hypothetical protein